MPERPALAWPFTRDLALGFAGGIAAILIGCFAVWWFRPRAGGAEILLRESVAPLPGASMRWFTFDLPRAGGIEIDASTARGEFFALHLATRPASTGQERAVFRFLPGYSAEEIAGYRRTGTLPAGQYHLVVLRSAAPPVSDEPATFHLRVRFRPAQRRASIAQRRPRRRNRFPGSGVPAGQGLPPAPGRKVRVFPLGRAALVACMLASVGRVSAASEPAPEVRDTLVFKNGDRVQGVVLSRQAGLVVFKSDRFGELRAASADVVVIPGETPADVAPPTSAAKAPESEASTPAERVEAERVSRWDRLSLSLLTAKLRDVFGPWHGRVALSTEAVVDNAERSSSSVDVTLRRKWSRDELQLKGRYDYAETNETPTSDVVRASAAWRRDFTKTYFMHYRPSAEWNRASRRQGVPNDYLLLQQEIGAGLQLFASAARKVRAGISHNRFDTWNSAPVADHQSVSAQSVFEEIDLKLPWRISLAQRGIWYPVPSQRDGWDGRIELNKKLTETLSVSFRYEIRRHNPDGSAQDYNKTKLLLGLDF